MLEVDDVGTPGTWQRPRPRREIGAAPPIDNYTDVFSTDNKGWSLYGAPWLQPAATGSKSEARGNGSNRRKPLPWVATGCLTERASPAPALARGVPDRAGHCRGHDRSGSSEQLELGCPPGGIPPRRGAQLRWHGGHVVLAVRGETISRSAISAFMSPSTRRANTSSRRAVSPAGLARVNTRRPWEPRIPSYRMRPATRLGSGLASSPRVISSDSASACSSSSRGSICARS